MITELDESGGDLVSALSSKEREALLGLVVGAFARVGIALPQYTGDPWNSAVHIPLSDLEPGDLIFFHPDISHVGIYLGDGLMVDAPDFGGTARFSGLAYPPLAKDSAGPTFRS
jgi:cell wall-associated NlpC family hydrolase